MCLWRQRISMQTSRFVKVTYECGFRNGSTKLTNNVNERAVFHLFYFSYDSEVKFARSLFLSSNSLFFIHSLRVIRRIWRRENTIYSSVCMHIYYIIIHLFRLSKPNANINLFGFILFNFLCMSFSLLI